MISKIMDEIHKRLSGFKSGNLSSTTMKLITLALITLIFTSCAHRTKTVTPNEIVCYGTDPLYHTLYKGSDEEYHYFRYSKGKVFGFWKVKRDELELSETFSRNSNQKRFVERDESGRLKLMSFKKVQ